MLIYQTKTFHASYCLVYLNPKLKDIRAFGTDGEVDLIKTIQMAFASADHLRCTNHLKQDNKLQSLGIGHSTSEAILTDVFWDTIWNSLGPGPYRCRQ